MAALTRRVSIFALLLGVIIPYGVAQSGDELERAAELLLQAEIEKAQALAQQVVDTSTAAIEAGEDPGGRNSARAARALDLIAQGSFSLGDTDRTREAIDRLIEIRPDYRSQGEIAGSRFVELLLARRSERVGYLALTCEPLDCESVNVDGRSREVDAEGRVALLAGRHRVVLGRHGFESRELGEIEIGAGETKDVTAELHQVARDVRLATLPAGVQVDLDGEPAGRTASPDGTGPGRIELRDVEPGSHVIVLRLDCYQRTERRLEVVLDQLEPGPLDLGVVELQPARAEVRIDWDREEGQLSLDGKPVTAGTVAVCPGDHELTLSLGGGLAYSERFSIEHGGSVDLAPRPRPTLLLVGDVPEVVPRSLEAQYNLAPPVADGGAALLKLLGDPLRNDPRVVPMYPRMLRRDAGDLAKRLAQAVPHVDLLVAWIDGADAHRPTRRVVFASPHTSLIEATAWRSARTDELGQALSGLLAPRRLELVPFAGVDVAGRDAGPPVIVEVHPNSPFEGLRPGMLLVAVDGEPIDGPEALARRVAAAGAGAELVLQVLDGAQQREVKAPLARTLALPTPAALREDFLLPRLAEAAAARRFGREKERTLGALLAGLVLAALGEDRPAAALLDRVDITAANDPASDARATVWRVLEVLMERLGSRDYAAELRARWKSLPGARFGSREGPPLALLP